MAAEIEFAAIRMARSARFPDPARIVERLLADRIALVERLREAIFCSAVVDLCDRIRG
jgi:hypothetical protein